MRLRYARGSLVAQGTVLGHGRIPNAARDGHLRFAIQPAGDPDTIDPRPILENWKLLGAALHPQGAKGNPTCSAPPRAMCSCCPKSQLELAVLSDPGIGLDACARHEIRLGSDRQARAGGAGLPFAQRLEADGEHAALRPSL